MKRGFFKQEKFGENFSRRVIGQLMDYIPKGEIEWRYVWQDQDALKDLPPGRYIFKEQLEQEEYDNVLHKTVRHYCKIYSLKVNGRVVKVITPRKTGYYS